MKQISITLSNTEYNIQPMVNDVVATLHLEVSMKENLIDDLYRSLYWGQVLGRS